MTVVLNRQIQLNITTTVVENKDREEKEICQSKKSVETDYAPTKRNLGATE